MSANNNRIWLNLMVLACMIGICIMLIKMSRLEAGIQQERTLRATIEKHYTNKVDSLGVELKSFRFIIQQDQLVIKNFPQTRIVYRDTCLEHYESLYGKSDVTILDQTIKDTNTVFLSSITN